MVDVDKLSDAELRTKLIEYGFPVMPITGTTRKLMVKKLKLLMDSKNKIGNDNRRSLGRYSSEEESDTDVKVVRKDKNRRATMAAPPAQPSVSRTSLRRSMRRHDSDDASESSRSSVTKDVTTSKRSTKIVKTVQDEFDTGSDSEPEIIENDYETTTRVTSTLGEKEGSPVSPSLSSSFRFQSAYSPKPTSASFSSLSNRPASSRFSTFSATTAINDGALDRLNQIRSRLSLSNQGYERSTLSTTIDSVEEKAETPFLSNFTRRLSQLSANSPKQEYDFKNDIIKEHDTNGASYNRAYLGRARFRDINRDYYSRHDSNIFKNNMVSFGVLAVAILFFLVVGAMYYGMRNSESALDVSGNVIPRCSLSDANARPGLNCIHEEDLEGALNLMKAVKPELARRAVAFACSDPGTPRPYMWESEVVSSAQERSSSLRTVVEQDLESLEVLIFRNPEWGIALLQTDGGDVGEENVLKNMEQVKHYRSSKSIALAILHPDVPWRCIVYNKLYAIFNAALFLSATFLALYFGNSGFKYFKQYQQRKKDEVFNMVERIVDVLQTNSAGEDDSSFLVINHVRDVILPISDRKKMEGTWLEAVRFINEHESRIRVEVQTIQGEPYEVWRWLGNPSLNTSGSPRSKTWQGQAFETQSGAVNSLPCSPTPCLKIRGMVDDIEPNLSAIKEAVLSKCAHLCRILHCAVDSTSKCVYIKCADQTDAAVAYRNLHGWWYAGHLVTVKYLRLERYMQRFPDSPASGPPYLKSISPPTDWSS